MRVLITGGSGYLGQYVVRSMLARGVSVRVLDRVGPPSLADSNLEVCLGDIRTIDLEPVLRGVDAVVHLAALLRGSLRDMAELTEGGTARLLAAMQVTRCDRIVLASTLSVYDWERVGASLDEDSPLLDEASAARAGAYAFTKLRQEMMVRGLGRAEGWTVSVLRPGVLWGGGAWGDYAVGPKLGPIRLLIGPTQTPKLAYVSNVAEAFASSAFVADGKEHVVNVIDHPGPTLWRYAATVGRRIGGVAIPVPQRLVSGVAGALSRLSLGARAPYFLRRSTLLSLHSDADWNPRRYLELVGVDKLKTFDQAIEEASAP